jgi:hypothetical protein
MRFIGKGGTMKTRIAIIIHCAVILAACAPSTVQTQTPKPPTTKTQTATVRPAATKALTKATRTSEPKAECIRWDKVRKSDKGKEVCVSGDVLFGITAEDGNGDIVAWFFRFSENPSSFYLVQESLPLDFEQGDCISSTGKLQVDDNGTAFIANGKLKRC